MEEFPQSPEKGETLEGYAEQAQKELEDLLVSKAGSEEDLREAFKDALVLSRAFELVITDQDGSLDPAGVQEAVTPLVDKHGLDASHFSIAKFAELAKAEG